VLAERDPVVQPRMMEMRYLRSPEFLSDLAELGLTLTRFRALKPIPAA
jgi:hypothetical protein